MRVEVLLLDGPAAGSGFVTDAWSWPPPKRVGIEPSATAIEDAFGSEAGGSRADG